MTSEGFGEMFEGDFSETCAKTILLLLMGGQATSPSVCRGGARTPIGVSGFFLVPTIKEREVCYMCICVC